MPPRHSMHSMGGPLVILKRNSVNNTENIGWTIIGSFGSNAKEPMQS